LFDDYARESDLKEVSTEAVDVSDARAATQIVAAERLRLLPVARDDHSPN
jgi:hypothetical protein